MNLLEHHDSSIRLRAALKMGTEPDPSHLDLLLARCAVEPDFNVRETLTWALIRHPNSSTVPRLIDQTRSDNPQARSQALHTLSKIGDPAGWPAITADLLRDPDDEVARSAWRAAVVLVPNKEKAALAGLLATQLGRGDRDLHRSLSRALVALGEVIEPVLLEIEAHADATLTLLRDPDSGFDGALEQAKRIAALGRES